ncbi:hypothetical protein ElyMa_003745500 [Elysia marginata]|uniref:Uncharacterized protein n=1 Tax=Elysia marginata TaxID=1093978 RepID=A0AAV4F685_9GAST|nr:hypothetical protein ElyMa_003745500 [Elysia marginata]
MRKKIFDLRKKKLLDVRSHSSLARRRRRVFQLKSQDCSQTFLVTKTDWPDEKIGQFCVEVQLEINIFWTQPDD